MDTNLVFSSCYLFTGNGYIGTTTYPRSKLHIKTARTISLQLNYYPIVHLNIEGLASEGNSQKIN